MAVFGYEGMISLAVASGSLELNAFMPLVAYSMLTSLGLLEHASETLARLCVDGMEADREVCTSHVANSHAAATALVPLLGHHEAGMLIQQAEHEKRPLRDVAIEAGVITAEQWEEITSPERVNALGTPSRGGKKPKEPA
jgi:aspartate ammonia-lyase